MATEIGRSLEEIDIKVKGLNKTLSASTAETKELDKALKLDPKAMDKDTLTKLVETVRVYSRSHITIIFKDGTELKADTNF